MIYDIDWTRIETDLQYYERIQTLNIFENERNTNRLNQRRKLPSILRYRRDRIRHNRKISKNG